MVEKYKSQAQVFKAFCDETRLEIIHKLHFGELCACVLIEQLCIAQSTLSYHMKILCESGVIESRQEGKWTYYQISKSGSNKAMKLLKEITFQTIKTKNENCVC